MNFRRKIFTCLFLFTGTCQVAFGSIHYLPCLRTVDFNTQGLECFSDHTIYMLIHVVEDGIQKLSENEAVYGCPIQHAFCNWSYPTSHSLTVRAGWNRFQHAFINCNGKKSCSLKKQYFKDAEDLFWRNCTTIQRHMNNVRQSIAYECISDYSVFDLCKNLTVSRLGNLYLRSDGRTGICRCDISGVMTGIVILHSYKTVIETDPSHQLPANINDEDIIYGQNISIRTRRFTVTVRLTSPESVVFLKVLIDDNVESNATARFIHVPAVPDRVTDISQNDVTNNTTNKIILDFTPVSNDIIGKVPDSSISIEIPSQVSGIVKWLVLVAILAFLSIMTFVLWKWQHRQTTCRKSDVSHSTYYTGLILDDAVTYGEPVHCKLPPQNKYIEVLPDLGGKLESV